MQQTKQHAHTHHVKEAQDAGLALQFGAHAAVPKG